VSDIVALAFLVGAFLGLFGLIAACDLVGR
jgi:hypothetical protein